MIKTEIKKEAGREHLWVSVKQHKPCSTFAAVIATLCNILQREVSRELDAGLNSATIDYHSIRLRLGFTACRRGAVREEEDECIPNTYNPAVIAEMLPRQKW